MNMPQALDEINRRFYERFASGFHTTREHGWTGWVSLLDELPKSDLTVLDIGCGNGRLARFLDKGWCGERNGSIKAFYGVDQCEALLDFARAESLSFPAHWSRWFWASILDASHAGAEGVSAGPDLEADWVTLFGVMHHVYGYERRMALLLWAASRLRVGGVLSVSLWDFGAHTKWDKKKLDWNDHAEQLNLDLAALESGDYLLGWAGDGDTPRYCHWVSRQEEQRMVADVQARTGGRLSSGKRIGSEADLNRYWCWRRLV
jgi:tRNA (uracil-5-)-methyltransferase TRM9